MGFCVGNKRMKYVLSPSALAMQLENEIYTVA